MTPEKREKLANDLAEHGLSVLLTRDFDSILIQLAGLAQFERLMHNALEKTPQELLDVVMEDVRVQQKMFSNNPETLRFLEIEDIPVILTAAHKHLHDQLGQPVQIDPNTVHAAVSAFVAILCRPSGA